MPLYHALGDELVPDEELSGATPKTYGRFVRPRIENAPPEFGKAAAPAAAAAAAPGPQDFAEIGPGKPLVAWIASAYPANLPPKKGFGRGRGALVASAVKSWATFDLQPRALNILKQSAERKKEIAGAATEVGTPIIFYSPAVLDRQLKLTVEIAFDDVDEALFNTISSVFGSAAGLPVFASAAPFLLAAQTLFKLGGAIGNRIFDNRAEFQATTDINIDLSGSTNTPAGFKVLTRSAIDGQQLAQYKPTEAGLLVRKDDESKVYDGDVPYIVIGLDGTEDNRLVEFKSTAASAALLQQFYNVREDGQTDADILISGLKFYNDFRYRSEADKVKKQLDAETNEEKKAKLQKQYDAIVKNIQSDEFKPK